jgi:hypothetical protein
VLVSMKPLLDFSRNDYLRPQERIVPVTPSFQALRRVYRELHFSVSNGTRRTLASYRNGQHQAVARRTCRLK